MNNNQELTTIYKAFMDIYKDAKVSGNQAIWSKGLVLFSLFNPSTKLNAFQASESDAVASNRIAMDLGLKSVESSPNAVSIIIDKAELAGTDYEQFVFYGYQLNTELHYVFCNYLVSKLQKGFESKGSDVTIDFPVLMNECNLDNKNTGFFKKVFIEVLDRMFHSSAKIVLKDGEINDRLIYKREMHGDIFNIKFGDIFIDAVVKDSWSKKINFEDKLSLKAGTPRILFDKIEMFDMRGEAKFSVKSMLKLLSLEGKPESQLKSLNRALQYFVEIGYVKEVIDVKRGKVVSEKIVMINKSFSLKAFAKTQTVKPIKSPAIYESVCADLTVHLDDAFPAAVSTAATADKESIEFHIANIVANFGKSSINVETYKGLLPEMAVDVDPTPEEIDPWKVEPDFEEWEREALENEPHRSTKDCGPRKVFENSLSDCDA
ncbi:hypothetical protein OX88_21580 [Pseudomonas coronafaciens pv. porri]|uniref:hypothetical protein n=1 Tax=Pseudomonas coronafaciens TaxID=53409 RepID=UPI0006ABA7C9|nr:hypothetical protein [Pseudomonas coronafaciens]KOP53081.1 hypothetical protein OX88_21580 [Pseudomonas coronafaciens pv. porri]